MTIESFFHLYPVFRYEEFLAWRKTQSTSTKFAVEKNLYYYVKTGRLLNVRRGVYAVVPPNMSPDDLLVDSYLLAGKATLDSVLAYHSALELHGVAYSVFNHFNFLTAQKSKPFEFQTGWFQPATIPKALKDKADFGIEKINRQGAIISMTNLARTFVDVWDRVNLSGGWEEVVRSISKMATLNVDEVIHYCLLLNNRILAAKVGFFLEQRQGAFAVSDKILQPLLRFIPTVSRYTDDNRRETFRLVKKWNVMMPVSVLDETWEKANYDV